MKKLKILYIADGNSLHDLKWISYFSAQQNKFNCYLLCESISEISNELERESAPRTADEPELHDTGTEMAVRTSSAGVLKRLYEDCPCRRPCPRWR